MMMCLCCGPSGSGLRSATGQTPKIAFWICFGALQWCLFPVGVLVTIGGMLALSVARQGARSEGAAAGAGAEAGGKPAAARTSGAKVMPARAAAAGVAAATPGALPPLAA